LIAKRAEWGRAAMVGIEDCPVIFGVLRDVLPDFDGEAASALTAWHDQML
jgi:hypothetical protein